MKEFGIFHIQLAWCDYRILIHQPLRLLTFLNPPPSQALGKAAISKIACVLVCLSQRVPIVFKTKYMVNFKEMLGDFAN